MAKRFFLESELQFSFPEDWTVIKYDEHRFYRYLSGAGLKGVDFIAIHEEELILIEVKNYAIRFAKEGHVPMDILLADRQSHLKNFSRKFEDTFRLLDIIEQYYSRKWWYKKVFQPFKTYLSETFILKRETGFWSKAIDLLDQPEKVKLILWLELAPDYDGTKARVLNEYFQQAIQTDLTEGMSVFVAHSKQPYGGILCKLK